MFLVTWALVVLPALTSGAFCLLGVAILFSLSVVTRRNRRLGLKTPSSGVAVAGVSALAMAGLFAFILIFYVVTG